MANWKDAQYKGITIPRGSFVSSIKKLATELNIKDNEVRTAIKHLIETGEITKQSTNIITYSPFKNCFVPCNKNSHNAADRLFKYFYSFYLHSVGNINAFH